MKNDIDYSVIISTCEKYSDLWDIYFNLFKKNWPDCPAKVYLVTDAATDRCFEGVEIISAGEDTEITERLDKALSIVDSRYILFTLDDYFLTEKIDNSKIDTALRFINDHSVDYVRLYSASRHYLRREGAQESFDYPGYFFRDISEGNYKVSLYAGLWRTDFMRKTLKEKRNAWQYEVALTQMARDMDARCAISNHHEFPILDVIRKGKLLHKADSYLRKNGYHLNTRQIISYRVEFSIWLKTKMKHILPRGIVNRMKKAMVRRGHIYYSDN